MKLPKPDGAANPHAFGTFVMTPACAGDHAKSKWGYLTGDVSQRNIAFMTYEVLFAGVGGTVIGTLLGSLISARLTYGFQKRLLQQQLDFQKKQADEDADLRQKIYEEWRAIFTEFRNMLNTRAAQLVGSLSKPDSGAK